MTRTTLVLTGGGALGFRPGLIASACDSRPPRAASFALDIPGMIKLLTEILWPASAQKSGGGVYKGAVQIPAYEISRSAPGREPPQVEGVDAVGAVSTMRVGELVFKRPLTAMQRFLAEIANTHGGNSDFMLEVIARFPDVLPLASVELRGDAEFVARALYRAHYEPEPTVTKPKYRTAMLFGSLCSWPAVPLPVQKQLQLLVRLFESNGTNGSSANSVFTSALCFGVAP